MAWRPQRQKRMVAASPWRIRLVGPLFWPLAYYDIY
jgi:hypothetical protein